MPVRSPPTQSSAVPNIKLQVVPGAAAGPVTVTGIGQYDQLISVVGFKTADFSSLGDLTSQFTITGTNTIDNTGGTSTNGYVLVIAWWPRPTKLG